MALIQLDNAKIRATIERLGYPPAEPNRLHLLGVRGAIDVHRGGTAKNPVGKWSAGCQVIAAEGWEAFWGIIETSPQERFRYYLIDFASLLVE